MKSRIYRLIVVLIVAACFFDWPQPSSAIPTRSLVKGCSKVTKEAESIVNKSTVEAEKIGNEVLSSPTAGRAVYQGGRRIYNNNTTQTSTVVGSTCKLCSGSGYFNGHVCLSCHGTGRK